MANCIVCGTRAYSQYCVRHKPRTALKRTPIKKTGKHAKLWANARAEWFKNNPADSYSCYICSVFLLPHQTQLDHIRSRVRAPELRYEQSNLAPICAPCNKKKGSRDLDEINQ